MRFRGCGLGPIERKVERDRVRCELAPSRILGRSPERLGPPDNGPGGATVREVAGERRDRGPRGLKPDDRSPTAEVRRPKPDGLNRGSPRGGGPERLAV